MISVLLTADEAHLAASHAILRRHRKLCGERKDRAQNLRSSYDNEVCGAMAEIAVCKYKNVFWSGAAGLRSKDGGDVEVRWTHHEGTGGLIVYSQDSDESVFVLCDGYNPIKLVGWLRGRDAKQMAEPRGSIAIVPRARLNKFNPISAAA